MFYMYEIELSVTWSKYFDYSCIYVYFSDKYIRYVYKFSVSVSYMKKG